MVFIFYIPQNKIDFYIGYTIEIETRLEFHKDATSHKFTAKANEWNVFLKFFVRTKLKVCKWKSILKI